MSPGPYTWILLGSTFLLSALWAAVLLVLVRLRESGSGADPARGSHMAVELAWAVIPALLVLAVVVPALQSGGTVDPGQETAHMAEVAPGR